jgi:hypothetical protein
LPTAVIHSQFSLQFPHVPSSIKSIVSHEWYAQIPSRLEKVKEFFLSCRESKVWPSMSHTYIEDVYYNTPFPMNAKHTKNHATPFLCIFVIFVKCHASCHATLSVENLFFFFLLFFFWENYPRSCIVKHNDTHIYLYSYPKRKHIIITLFFHSLLLFFCPFHFTERGKNLFFLPCFALP